MSVNLRIKLAKASELIQALRILQDEPGASGSLRIKDGKTVGTVVFAKGRITGAALSPSGQRGETALEKLAGLKRVNCNYSKRQKTFLTETPLDIPFEKYIAQLTTQGDSDNETFPDESSARGSEVEQDQNALTRLEEVKEEPPAEETVETDKISDVELPAQDKVHLPVNETTDGNRRRVRSPVSEIILALGAFRHVPIAELLGILCLGALVVGIVVVPSRIKGSVGGLAAEQRARESLSQAINEDLLADDHQKSAELAPRRAPKKINTELPPGGIEILNEDLRAGRLLMSRNKPTPAIPYFESYVRVYPDNIKVRTELIDAYIANGDNHSARLLCIRTLKGNLNSEQMTTIWRHFQRCQTN